MAASVCSTAALSSLFSFFLGYVLALKVRALYGYVSSQSFVDF